VTALVPDALNPGKFYPPTAQHAIRQAATLAKNIVATMRAQPPEPFKFKILGLLAAIGRRAGVAEILGMKFLLQTELAVSLILLGATDAGLVMDRVREGGRAAEPAGIEAVEITVP
jgi:NADH dehydrogenase FAD-containing subunit